MAIPDFQSMFQPTLKLLSDNEIWPNTRIVAEIASSMRVTPEELEELLPSGRQPKFTNRVYWTLVHLTKAGLLERIGRGQYRITELGHNTLTQQVSRIDLRYLKTLDKYKEWQNQFGAGEDEGETTDTQVTTELGTPQERMDHGYTQFRAALADEILSKVKSCSPRFFERLVVELLVKMGYGGSVDETARVVGKSGDGGIDGIIKEDKLGLDIIYVQAKRWENPVGAKEVRDFSGSLDYHGAKKGVFITTSDFTKDAREYVTRTGEKKIVLLTGFELAQLMIDHDIGVSTVTTYSIKRIDSDYFEE
ncbi:restriction endonuclease [bacterium]|nr:restriction endonuclease [bacterium]